MKFKIESDYRPTGDQPEAIQQLEDGIKQGLPFQTLLGVTGSGKTFTIANVIEKIQRSTLVLSHNKTLAAQLFGEFKQFFPNNAVEYFVSYYDYYQPESYIPQKDQYIEKDADINPKIEQMRLSATASLLSRNDVIVVASVFAVILKDLIAAAIAVAAMSLLLSLEFYILQAPDVAIAEAGVGACLTTAILVIAIRATRRMEEEG